MKRQVLVFAGLIAVGAVLGATLVTTNSDPDSDHESDSQRMALKARFSQSNAGPATTSNTPDLQNINQALDDLENKLQQEIENRKKLETKIARLEKQLKSFDATVPAASQEDTGTADTSAQENPHQAVSTGQSFSGGNDQWFNEQAMLDAGVDPTKVNFIKQSFEQAEMDRLYLRNQAKREGWINTDRYTDAAKQIIDRTDALRNQLSDAEYDAYLYAAGRSNRVIVSSLLSASPASNAGIQPGDTILKYDNKRVYNWSDLTNATSEGTPDETVTVTIERNGQLQQVYLPRGPLGVRLTTDSVAP